MRQAPDSCTEMPPATSELGSICGSIQNQGKNTSPARNGVSSGPPSMRQGRSHSAVASVSRARAVSRSESMAGEYGQWWQRPP